MQTRRSLLKRNVVILVLVVVAAGAVFVTFLRPSASRPATYDLVWFLEDARRGNVARVDTKGEVLDVTLRDGTSYRTSKDANVTLSALLEDAGVDASTIEIASKPRGVSDWVGLFVQFAPLAALATIAILLLKSADPGR